jgi:AcrR family transcriptional regulator
VTRAPAKIDRRTARTHAALRDALVVLMTEKGYEAITVQDILDRANVGRATFYAHFEGKQALHEAALDGLAAELRRRRDELRASGEDGFLACCTAMFEHADSHRALYRGLISRRGGATVMHGVRARVAVLVREDLASRRRSKSGGVPLDLLVEHVVSGFTATLTWWLDRRTKYGPKEIDAVFREMTLSGVLGQM